VHEREGQGLLGAQLFVEMTAVAGGAALVAVPSGRLLAVAPSVLARTPFADFFVPGLVAPDAGVRVACGHESPYVQEEFEQASGGEGGMPPSRRHSMFCYSGEEASSSLSSIARSDP
jgi:hypothetical protein